MAKEKVILVDENNNAIGVEEKMKAHEEGKLHRAFSIFIFNSKKELLLQRRAQGKYHCGGLWTNTCCSHPRPGEKIIDAAKRRLKEEMGIITEDIWNVSSFVYKAILGNGLTEHEYDYVLVGNYNESPRLNPKEADGWKWVTLEELKKDVKENADNYTPWFRIILEKYLSKL